MAKDEVNGVVQPQEVMTAGGSRSFTIGLPLGEASGEKRFPLTPEGVALLVEAGFSVRLQEGASASIHYTDMQYMRAGAEVTGRDSALGSDIVINLAPLTAADARRLKRGAMLLTLSHPRQQEAGAVKEMLRRHVTVITLDRITDKGGHAAFADILAEIDGRAAIALCSSMLARPDHGKGILLGGVAGIIPCEVTIIGSGIAACAAAMSAVGLGAMVRMLDNDIYRLREAVQRIGPGVVASSIHPHVLENALRSADVVIATAVAPHYVIDSGLVDVMKKGVIVMDVDYEDSPAFPSLPAFDIADCSARQPGRVCYTGIGNAVPRTSAMALSNTLLPLLRRVAACESVTDSVRLVPEMRSGVCAFMGKAVSHSFARIAGVRPMDINLLLNCC